VTLLLQNRDRCLSISAPRLDVYYFCRWLCLCVCASVCLSRCSFKSILVFRFSMESSHFWPSSLHVALYKMLFFDFWFRLPNAQNLLPKICNCTKSPISRLVWQIDRRCLSLLGGFRGWPIQWNHAECCGADPCCHGNDNWPRRGDLVACMILNTLIMW